MVKVATLPKRINNTVVNPFKSEKKQNLYIIKNPITGQFILANEKSLFIWDLLDGKHTVDDIKLEFEKKFSKTIELRTIEEFLAKLAELCLIESDSLKELQERKTKKLAKKNIFVFNFPLLKLKHLKKANSKMSPLFKKRLFYSLLILNGVACIFSIPAFFHYLLNRETFVFFDWVLIGDLIFMTTVYPLIAIFHEMSHAIALLHYNVSPNEVGLKVKYSFLSFYTDARDSWLLPRKERMITAIVGPIFTIFMGNCLFLINQVIAWVPIRKYVTLLVFGCFFLALSSLNPLRKGDGYFFLSDFLDIPNIYSQFKMFIRKSFKKSARGNNQKNLNRKLAFYGFLVVAYYVLFSFVNILILIYIGQDVIRLIRLILGVS